MIEALSLTKRYGSLEAVRDLTLHVPKGELFGLVGPNGAGKTTTIGMLTGQLSITSGQARINGLDVGSDAIAIKKILGILSEQPFLYEKLTGREFLYFVGTMYEVDRDKKAKKVEGLLDLFDMKTVGDDLIESYSHGMRKKIALCATLLHDPQILFWDEPTGGLDARTAFIVKELMRRLCQRGVTVFFTTHILEVAEHLCDRVGIIVNGHLQAVGSLEELRRGTDASLEEVFLKLTGEVDVGKIEGIL